MLAFLEKRVAVTLAVLLDRFRSRLVALRGASIGIKNRIGKGCVIQSPWCLKTGSRVQFEHNIYLKVTSNSANISLGDEVFVGCGTEMDVADKIDIGDHVLIAPGCFITDHSHRYSAGDTIASQGCQSAPVRIEEDVWLGAHSVVLPGVTIGKGAIVAAGAVVNRDVDPMIIVAGVPAKPVGSRG